MNSLMDFRDLTVQVKPTGQEEILIARDTTVLRHLPVTPLAFMHMAVYLTQHHPPITACSETTVCLPAVTARHGRD